MSSKRQATSELNHENWDKDDKPEQRGTFRTATEDELKNRVIKKARRNITGIADKPAEKSADDTTKAAFSSFSGFKNIKPIGSNVSSAFAFLSKIPASTAESTSTTTSSTTKEESPKTTFSFAHASNNKINETSVEKNAENKEKSAEYFGKVKGLNQAVSEWIKQHVDKNPLCILTPIFKDYEKHLKEIEDSNQNNLLPKSATTSIIPPVFANEEKKSTNIFGGTTNPRDTLKTNDSSTPSLLRAKPKDNSCATPIFSFGLKANDKIRTPSSNNSESKNNDNESTSPKVTFNFGANIDKPIAPPSKLFSFGKTSEEKPSANPLSGFMFGKPLEANDDKKPTGFSFSSAPPFSFGNIQPPTAINENENKDEEDEDQPPKVEFKQVVEEDAVYSKKCKVFVKKDGNFVDRGVGTLYLKPVEKSDKTQMIVRADTNLGNILVNLILNSAIPAQRMGKNNVVMVCLPTPDIDKPTSLLLRVKTGEEADDLLETIEKYKK